jgi:hypothetical protein
MKKNTFFGVKSSGGTPNRKKLAVKIRGFKNEAAFLKFIRSQPEADKDKICELFPDNAHVQKYLADRGKGKNKENDTIQILSDKDIEKVEKDIEDLLDKSPLNAPFLTGIHKDRFYEPHISYFSKRPKLDKDIENDTKFFFRIINTHLTQKSPIFTKDEIRKKLVSVSKKRGAKNRHSEVDLRTVLALHDWSLARSRTLPKNEKNDLFINALTNLSWAMYIGGFSYFNISSFGLIHSEYIKNYKLLLEEKHRQILKNSLLYDFLPALRNHLSGNELLMKSSKFLNNRLINMFETHSLDFKLKKLYSSDLKKALSNYFKDDPDKMVNGIHSKVYIFLYLDLLVYLAGIFQMDLPELLSENNSFKDIAEKDYDIALRVHALKIKQLLYHLFWSLSQDEAESAEVFIPDDPDTAIKPEPTPYDLLCKIVAACNQSIYEIRKKANIDRYIQVKYYELYPLYRYYDALVNYIPFYEINRDIKVFTINFIRDALFFKQQAIARQKEDRIINVIQKMVDILKSLYKRRVEEYKSSMIKAGEPDYTASPDEDGGSEE